MHAPERRGTKGDKEKLTIIPLLGKQDHVAANNALVSKLGVLGVQLVFTHCFNASDCGGGLWIFSSITLVPSNFFSIRTIIGFTTSLAIAP